VLTANAEPAILVGNSIGGVIPTQAAARHPGSVAALVYATAFVPRDGQSLLDLTRLPEGAEDQVQANIVIEPPLATMPAAASRSALYGSCSESDAAWAIFRQRPQPLGPFTVPVSIPTGALDRINRYFVLCTKDRAIPAALQRRMITENSITNVIELDIDHTPHLSMTAALGDALQEFAAHAARSAPA
jgi:pimeloyl-ACP methyl ester carboxylesterase